MIFKGPSIKRKLVGIISLTTLLVLTLAFVVLLTYETRSYRETAVRSLTTMADIIAGNSSSALIFEDNKVAQEILAGLQAEPEIIAAALYNAEGELYATYPADLRPETLPPLTTAEGTKFQARQLAVFKAVVQGDKRVGTLYLAADLQEMYRRLTVYVMVLLGVLAGSGAVVLFLSNLFQRRISEPLLELARTAKIVSEQKDYSVRAAKKSEDEVGFLTESFNGMLDQIQASDSALRESETRMSAVFNQAGAGIAQCDLTGRFLMLNDRYCEITGRTRAELLKTRLQDITASEDLASSQALFSELLKGASAFVMEMRYVRASGDLVWVRNDIAPLRNTTGAVESILAVTQDITERKRAEQALVGARDAAERANRAKDDFLAALSHELRTPLNPVLLIASEAAQDASLPNQARADFQTIVKNITLEARLIDDLLDLTRISRGKLALESELVDAHIILRDAIATVQAEVKRKQLDLQVALMAEKWQVRGDAVRLQQVFWNILKNAVKFTPDYGTINVTTSLSREREEFTLVVTDTGIGLTGTELAQVFEAFTQGEHAAGGGAHRFGGLGLGLAITQKLVEAHGGTISAASKGRDQGATFTVTLPLAVTSSDTEFRPKPAAISKEPVATLPPGLRLLLVEDHEPTRMALARLLVRRHHDVDAAATVSEALAYASRQQYDLLISDIGLPDGNGYDLMKELRARYRLPGIALTGYGMEYDMEKSQTAGFLAHLTKPVRVQELETALAMASPAVIKRESTAR